MVECAGVYGAFVVKECSFSFEFWGVGSLNYLEISSYNGESLTRKSEIREERIGKVFEVYSTVILLYSKKAFEFGGGFTLYFIIRRNFDSLSLPPSRLFASATLHAFFLFYFNNFEKFHIRATCKLHTKKEYKYHEEKV